MRTPAADPAGRAVADTLFQALAVLRLILLANTIGLYVYRQGSYPHPVAGAWAMVGLAAWTFAAAAAYSRPARRRWPLLVVDLSVALAAILVTPYVKGPGLNATLPGFWVMAVVLAWAIVWRVPGGLVSAGVISVADLSIRNGDIDQTNYANIFLLLLGGTMVGFLAGLLQRMAAERDRAERDAAAAAERQRLARAVHDGVLQVLALVQRRGAEIGGEAAELGRLAGEQEVALRALVQQRPPDADSAGTADLAVLLTALATPSVTVSVPGRPVTMAAHRAGELAAIVEACLSNVRHHVGVGAPAWVLLEELGEELMVSVRDEGPGIPPGRLEEAAAQGRLGVVASIRGRAGDLGGSAALHTAPGEGTEWEITVPREDR